MQRPINGDPLSAGGSPTQVLGGLTANGYAVVAPDGTSPPPAVAGLPVKAGPSFTDLANALKRRLVLATFLGLLVGVAAAAAGRLAMPSGKHKVRALVHVRSDAGLTGQYPAEKFDEYKKTQERLVRTRNVLNMVLADPQVSRLSLLSTAPDPAQYLDESVRVAWEAPRLMAVSMIGDNHAELKVLVDAVVNCFVESAKSEELREGVATRKKLEQAIQRLDEKVTARRQSIERSLRSSGAASDPLGTAALLTGATTDLGMLASDIYAEEAKVRNLDIAAVKHQNSLAAVDAMPLEPEQLEDATRADPVVQEKLTAVAAQEKRVQTLLGTLEASSPTVLKAQADIRKGREDLARTLESLRPATEKAIRTAMKRNLDGQLHADRDELDTRKKQLEQMYALRRTKEEQVKELRRGGADIKTDDDDLRPLLEQRGHLAKLLVELGVTEKQDARIQLKEEAVVLFNHNQRQKMLVVAGAFIGGTVLVLLTVGYLEWRSRRVDSVAQVVNDLGLRVLGTVPAFPSKQALKSGDAAQNQNWRFVLNESVNSARTLLLHSARNQNMQVLMVTSAIQGEGKTSLASQLATSMAAAGLRTLILDCDLRNPSMHKLFDAALSPGCSEVLCQEVDVSDVVQPTSVPNLWLIPAGQCSHRVISALAQGHPLETLFNRLRGQFDYIVVDSCPVLPVADTLLVGQHVDGVVLSILQDISQLPKVRTTAERLTLLNIPLLGSVVNGIRPDTHAYGYNYVKQIPA